MLYAVFIWEKWETDADFDPSNLERYQALHEEISATGSGRGGAALHPVDVATTMRVRDDQVLMVDGPYLESKEHLSGFYLLECADLDEVVELASKIPGARHGAIEIRPVLMQH